MIKVDPFSIFLTTQLNVNIEKFLQFYPITFAYTFFL